MLAAAVGMVVVATLPDASARAMQKDLEAGTPKSIGRVLRHISDETRLDADDRLIPFLTHEDKRTRERVLRHVSRLDSSRTAVAILDAVKSGHLEVEQSVKAIEDNDNPLSRKFIEDWLDAHDGDGTWRSALADHLAMLRKEERRWGAPPHTASIMAAQMQALAEGNP
jgi:hypothetical protein